VGPVTNEYIYTLVSTEHTSRNDWVWECAKPAHGWDAEPGEVLFIIHVTDALDRRTLMAMHAPAGTRNVEEVHNLNKKVFASSEDVFVAGAQSWQSWSDDQQKINSNLMEFTTTILEDSAT
jgi:hypothetical protein